MLIFELNAQLVFPYYHLAPYVGFRHSVIKTLEAKVRYLFGLNCAFWQLFKVVHITHSDGPYYTWGVKYGPFFKKYLNNCCKSSGNDILEILYHNDCMSLRCRLYVWLLIKLNS